MFPDKGTTGQAKNLGMGQDGLEQPVNIWTGRGTGQSLLFCQNPEQDKGQDVGWDKGWDTRQDGKTLKVPFFLCLILVGVSIKFCQAGEDDEYDKRYSS